MPPDPERKVESLLRQYAGARDLEAGDPVLHPATRRLLQGEVARHFGKRPAPAGASSFWRNWLPRLAWIAPALLLVLGNFFLFRSTEQSKTIDRNTLAFSTDADRTASHISPGKLELRKEVPSDRAATELRSLDRISNAPAVTSVADLAAAPAAEEKRSVTTLGEVAPGAPVAPSLASIVNPPAPEKARAQASRELRDNFDSARLDPPSVPLALSDAKLSNTTVANSPMPTMRLERTGTALASGTAKSSRYRSVSTAVPIAQSNPTQPNVALRSAPALTQAVLQRFSNQATALGREPGINFKPAAAGQVLTSFHVEQSGEQLRVVDKDGSVYSGSLELPVFNEPVKVKAETQTHLAEAVAKDAVKLNFINATGQNFGNYAFQVVGTNRTLNQRVVFNGTMQEAIAPALISNYSNLGATVQTKAQLTQNVQWLNTRINGKAIVGEAKEIPIDAVPEP